MAVVSKACRRRQGFTLLELLVTISIIGILMAIGSVSFATAQKKGRDSRRQGDMKAIQKALEECYALDSEYPAITFGSSLECEDGTVTMNQVPDDPKPGEDYTYTVDDPTTVSNYCLCAELENTGRGNASDLGSLGVCTFVVDGDYFCVSNQQ